MGDYIAYGSGLDGEPTKMIANSIQPKLKPIADSIVPKRSTYL